MAVAFDDVVIREQAESYGCKYIDQPVVWSGYRKFIKVGHEFLGRHYAEWARNANKMGLLSPEFLVPRIVVPYENQVSRAMAMADDARARDEEAFRQLLHHHWGYYFYLGGGSSTVGDERLILRAPLKQKAKYRSLHRLRLIARGLESILGSFEDARILDMACNWGGFSLEFAARKALFVNGVDLRLENIAKAEALRQYLGIQNVAFDRTDVYDLPAEATYDVVLNLGLLYHVTKQYELVSKTYELCKRIGVIETVTHLEPFSGFIFGSGRKIPTVYAAGEKPVEFHPTYRGLIDMMLAVGFRKIVELEAEPDPAWTDFNKDIFGRKLRRCLVGFK